MLHFESAMDLEEVLECAILIEQRVVVRSGRIRQRLFDFAHAGV